MNDETIFAAALEKTDPAERIAYLDSACADDPARRRRIDALLAAVANASGFLERPAVSPSDFAETISREPLCDEATATRGGYGHAEGTAQDVLGFLDPPTRADSLGRIGHYDVLEVLGQGGFGIVYRAYDEVLQRIVAVKVLAPSMAVTSPARKRFLREARSAAPIQHENVVRIHETGESPLPYLVMEFVPGDTLQQWMDRTGPIDPHEALKFARQIASGLAAAHEQGLIHRDIKPSNVLIESGRNQAKITDFGLARAADDASLTRSGTVAGTPMYMAPEQARGETLDQRADLFSLGSVLYAMLTGHPPFRAGNTPAVLKRVTDDTPRPIREVIPEVPEWLCRIVEKLHAKNPADRFQTAKEAADLLGDCERQLASHAQLTDLSRIPVSSRLTAPTKPGRPRRMAVRLAVAAFVLLAAVWWFARPLWLGATGQGDLIIETGEGLVSVIVLQNDEGVLDSNKLHPPVTDWMGMTRAQSLTLPAGKYQINVNTWPVQDSVSLWEVTTSGVFGASPLGWIAVERTSAIITVERGQRVTIRPKMVSRPKPPEPTVISPRVSAPGFTPLFNGKDLAGWKHHDSWRGAWDVEGGELVGRKGLCYLQSEREFGDFHLVAEMKVSGGTGVYFRASTPPGNYPIGWVADTCGFLLQRAMPGWTGVGPIAPPTIPSNSWFKLEIIAVGDEIILKANGKTFVNQRVDSALPKKGLLMLHAHEGAEIRFREIAIKELPPAELSWVPLFNGKDLAGWKEAAGSPPATARDGALVFEKLSYVCTEKRYQNYELRLQYRHTKPPDGQDNLHLMVHLQKELTDFFNAFSTMYMLRLQNDGTWVQEPAFGAKGAAQNGKAELKPRGEWNDVIVRTEEGTLELIVNGRTVSTLRGCDPKEGMIGIQNWAAELQVRNIEIRELPVSAPKSKVPKSAFEVPGFMIGRWAVERQYTDPKTPMEKATGRGTYLFDQVAEGTVLRGRGNFGPGEDSPLLLYTYDPESQLIHHRQAWSNGTTVDRSTGVFNPDSGSMLWSHRFPDGTHGTHEFTFVNTDTMRTRFRRTDSENNLVREMRLTFTRLRDDVAVPELLADPKRPPEMAVLDRLIGDWNSVLTVKSGTDAPVEEKQSIRVTATLGGRFIEVTETAESTKQTGYSLIWYDADRKHYRQWFFHPAGYNFELYGSWDDSAKSLTWGSPDGRLQGYWLFKADGAREQFRTAKDPAGKLLHDARGTVRKRDGAGPPAVTLRRFDPAKDKPEPPFGAKPVTIEGGAWRIENDTNRGNWKVHFDTLFENLPADGLIVFRAQVKVKANDKRAWGTIQLGAGEPAHYKYEWPSHLGQYVGDVPEWTQKEVRYPARIFQQQNPAQIPVYVSLHAAGIMWVKDAEILHIPEQPAAPPVPAPSEPVRIRRFDPAKDRAVAMFSSDVKRIAVEDGALKIETGDKDSRAFTLILGEVVENIPKDGLFVFRAKVKAKATHPGAGGSLSLNHSSPSFHDFNWPTQLSDFAGDVPDWTQKEVRYPASIFHKLTPPTVTMMVRLYEGTLWLKDVELWYVPEGKKLDSPGP